VHQHETDQQRIASARRQALCTCEGEVHFAEVLSLGLNGSERVSIFHIHHEDYCHQLRRENAVWN
jgi:hypothetical protein